MSSKHNFPKMPFKRFPMSPATEWEPMQLSLQLECPSSYNDPRFESSDQGVEEYDFGTDDDDYEYKDKDAEDTV